MGPTNLAEAKVGDFCQPQRVEEDVGWLEVVMNDAVPRLVEVHQRVEDLGDDGPGLLLGEHLTDTDQWSLVSESIQPFNAAIGQNIIIAVRHYRL